MRAEHCNVRPQHVPLQRAVARSTPWSQQPHSVSRPRDPNALSAPKGSPAPAAQSP